MKNPLLLLAAGLLISLAGFSQNNTPAYKKNPNIPAFQLERPNNNVFKSSQIKNTAPALIMFFSPGCDHCIHQFEDMKKRIKDFKNVQIVMATIQPAEELAAFNKKYKIANYPNIVTGRDAEFFLPNFYGIANFPYMAFYKKGKLVTTHEGNLPVDQMLKHLR